MSPQKESSYRSVQEDEEREARAYRDQSRRENRSLGKDLTERTHYEGRSERYEG